jgi:hypothetical protein
MNIIFHLIKKSISTKVFDNSDKVLIKHSCYLMEIFTDTAETFYNWLNISYDDWIDKKK